MTPKEWYDIVEAALLPYGFHDGKYGDVPYCLKWPEDFELACTHTTFSSASAIIIADGRQMGYIHFGTSVGVQVYLDIAHWATHHKDELLFRVWENVGMAVHNDRGVVRINTSGPKIERVDHGYRK